MLTVCPPPPALLDWGQVIVVALVGGAAGATLLTLALWGGWRAAAVAWDWWRRLNQDGG